ncbi:hypothetical protein JOD02_000339 [Caldicoprobacter guelmensis]|uniref:ACT domain-containing protein n=1 Tax=Caldicoprobacter guelmensis TaxID=1170224 RepID=UPI00195EEB52|nr:ACT domain-containing protein [Caldicoprobacter guelmensis]MBM7581516.1 hypothetical protein [Caldicoprobacter guelmensis]
MTQISVFLENKKGKLAEVTKVLAEHNIDMCAISIADTTNFGILRIIVDNPEKALEVLREAGYTVNTTEVLAVEVPDRPGGLHRVLEILSKGDISVEYLYSFVRRPAERALILFKVDDLKTAKEILKKENVSVLTVDDVNGLGTK